jgi:hypothetical protein
MRTSSGRARRRAALLLALPFLILAGLILAGSNAKAAPQILGIVASSGLATPLHCENGYCSASLASFCLQEARYAPRNGHDYRLAPGGRLTIIAETSSGATLRIPAEKLLDIRTRTGFTAVRVGLPQAKLDQLGARAAAVEVGPETTILPVASKLDPDPQSAEEITAATGPLWRLATRTFDRPSTTADAARLIELVLNDLPERSTPAPGSIARLWRGIAESARRQGLNGDSIQAAGDIVAECRGASGAGGGFWSAACLEMQEAELMTTLNRKFWDETAGGS